MFNRFFPTGAVTADDHECANCIAAMLIGMYESGEIEKAFNEIYSKGWQVYLTMARKVLEFSRNKSQKSANQLSSVIRNELQSKEFESTGADAALRELNNMAHMGADADVPEGFKAYSYKIGHYFEAGWASLGKSYIQFQAAVNKYEAIIKLVDAEMKKHPQLAHSINRSQDESIKALLTAPISKLRN